MANSDGSLLAGPAMGAAAFGAVAPRPALAPRHESGGVSSSLLIGGISKPSLRSFGRIGPSGSRNTRRPPNRAKWGGVISCLKWAHLFKPRPSECYWPVSIQRTTRFQPRLPITATSPWIDRDRLPLERKGRPASPTSSSGASGGGASDGRTGRLPIQATPL